MLSISRLSRRVLYRELHESRARVLARGHDWDVADVLAVLERLGVMDG